MSSAISTNRHSPADELHLIDRRAAAAAADLDVAAAVELVEDGGFVGRPALLDGVELRIGRRRDEQLAQRDPALELRQMRAREVVAEVAGERTKPPSRCCIGPQIPSGSIQAGHGAPRRALAA